MRRFLEWFGFRGRSISMGDKPTPFCVRCPGCGGTGERAIANAVVVLVREGRTRDPLVLAVTRRGSHTDYGIPGGKLENGESPAEGAARELYEETGLQVRPRDLIYVMDRIARTSGNWTRVFTVPLPLVRGAPNAQEHGVMVSWIPISIMVSEACASFRSFNRVVFAEMGLGSGGER